MATDPLLESALRREFRPPMVPNEVIACDREEDHKWIHVYGHWHGITEDGERVGGENEYRVCQRCGAQR